MPFDSPLTVTRVGDTTWMVVNAISYRGVTDRWTVPAGSMTDFASVPRVLLWLAPREGRWTPAAVLHDRLCSVEIAAGTISPRDVDGVFRRVMRELGVPPILRWLMWGGVRWGAAVNPIRRPGWWRDAPAVAALTVLAAPVVLPTAAVAAAALLIYQLAELAARLLDRT